MCINYELFVLCTRSTVFLYISLPLFLHDYNVKLITPFMEEMSHVFLFAFFFSLLLIFTLLAASISHFLTAPIKFSCFSSNEIGFLYLFISRSSSCAVINIKVDIEIQSKERLWGTRLRCCFFLFLKVRVAMQFTTVTREYLTAKFYPFLT